MPVPARPVLPFFLAHPDPVRGRTPAPPKGRPAVAGRVGPKAVPPAEPKPVPPRRVIPRTKWTEGVADTPLGKKLTAFCRAVLQERVERAIRAGRLDVLDDHIPADSISVTWPELALLLEILFPEDFTPPARPAARPSVTPAGSADRLRDYAGRAAAGEELAHPGDRNPGRAADPDPDDEPAPDGRDASKPLAPADVRPGDAVTVRLPGGGWHFGAVRAVAPLPGGGRRLDFHGGDSVTVSAGCDVFLN